MLSFEILIAQVDTAWVRRYNGPGNEGDAALKIAVDVSGNVYVTGSSSGTISTDYATIKYAPNGDTLWVKRYDGPINKSDLPTALVVDASGNVYVTGYSKGGGSYAEYATVKYAPNGDTLWVRRYNGIFDWEDEARAMAVDDSGNVYVTGASDFDYATIKYFPNGDTVWVRRYSGIGSDTANALAVDDSGYVYVTGWSHGFGTGSDFVTIKYAPNGDTSWVRRYDGGGGGAVYLDDVPYALAVDDSGNVYVTGESYVSGSSTDYSTVKYAANGDTIWVRRYNGPGNSVDVPNALAVDSNRNVYVTGYSVGIGTASDFCTIKYAPNGDTLWVRRYDGPGNYHDYANALAVDDSGNVYVTGQSFGIGTYYDYTTIKYGPNGDILWVAHFNGPGNGDDYANALAIDDSGNVYVTGAASWGAGLPADYTTIKYSPCSAKAGDSNSDGNIALPDIIFLVNYVFKGGPVPSPLCRGDENGSGGNANLADIIYLVNYVFKGGPAPQKSGVCCL